MTSPFIRKDMLPLAEELGCAPNAAQRVVEINRDVFEELSAIAKREHTSMKTLVNELLAAWLMRV